MQMPQKSSASNVHYILAAEFDNKYGPTIKYQHPNNIPGFETSENAGSNQKSVFHLASLMLPSNVEHKLSDRADYTVFILHYNRKSRTYQLFPNAESDSNDCLFFINAVIAQHDSSNSRGAKIKAFSLGTKMKCFNSFKPIVVRTLQSLLPQDTYESALPYLVDCFDSLNSLDLSCITRLHDEKAMQSLFCGAKSGDKLRDLLDHNSSEKDEVLRYLAIPHRDRYGNRLKLTRGHVCIAYDAYVPKPPLKPFKRSPLLIDLLQESPIKIDLKYHDLLGRFMIKFIPLLRKKNPTNFAFKLIIHSANFSKNIICQFVLALSNMIGCFSSNGKARYYNDGLPAIFPYMEVCMIDSIREYFASIEKSSHFVIMGTANPIFQLQHDLWDFYYDIDKDTLVEGGDRIGSDSNKRRESMSFRKMLNRNSIMTMSTMTNEGDWSLLGIFFEIVLREKPDNITLVNLLMKINMLQLLERNYFRDDTFTLDKHVLDDYIITYKDFVVFDDLFNKETSKVIRLLDPLAQTIDKIFELQNAPQDQYTPFDGNSLSKLSNILHDIYHYLLRGQNRVEIFLSICMRYPFVTINTNAYSLMNSMGSGTTFRELTEHLRVENSWLHLVDNYLSDTLIDTFARDRCLNLFMLPLLFNCEFKEKPSTYLVAEDSSASSNNERPRSMAFKWMSNFSNNKSVDNSIDSASVKSSSDVYSVSSVSTSKLISTTLSENSSFSTKMTNEELRHLATSSSNLSLKILRLIESNVVGKLVLKQNLHPYFLLVYRCVKSQQRDGFEKYEARLSNTEHNLRSVLHKDHHGLHEEGTKSKHHLNKHQK